jgi:hypothetical protein
MTVPARDRNRLGVPKALYHGHAARSLSREYLSIMSGLLLITKGQFYFMARYVLKWGFGKIQCILDLVMEITVSLYLAQPAVGLEQ